MPKKNGMEALLAREAKREGVNLVASIAGFDQPGAARGEAPEAAPVADADQALPASFIKSIVVPSKKESRNSRKQVVFTPTLERAIMRKCRAKGVSFNEAVNQLMSNWVESGE